MADSGENTYETEKRKQFGNRLLTDPKNVFEHNAWDNVVWDEEQEKEARLKAEEQLANKAAEEDIDKYEADASDYWNKFYGIHENRFFKDRHWLFTEFPELAPESYLTPDRLAELSLGPNDKKVTRKSTGNVSVVCDLMTESHKRLCQGNENKSGSSELSSDEQTDEVKDGLGNTISSLQVDSTQSLSENSDKSSQGNVFTDRINENNCVGQNHTDEDSHMIVKEKFPGERATFRIFEVGCGVGNTVFPILQANIDPKLMVYCCDYSSTAIDLVKENKDYDPQRCHAFVCDISDPEAEVPFPEESLDIIILIFILSANNPDRFQAILNRLASFLRPGGMILFRDYGRYDLAQLRFKKGKCLGENFYVRGDGTRVYFFTQDEMRDMMTKAGLTEKQNLVDRRLQVNRGKQLKMYRVWIQCKYMKPLTSDDVDKNASES